MNTHATFLSSKFRPTPGELDEDSDEYINPDIIARELSEFVKSALNTRGYRIKSDVVEDWGIWVELDTNGPVTFAVCCGNTSPIDDQIWHHRVFTEPDRPVVRRWFRKHDVGAELERLVATLDSIFRAEEKITDLEWI